MENSKRDERTRVIATVCWVEVAIVVVASVCVARSNGWKKTTSIEFQLAKQFDRVLLTI